MSPVIKYHLKHLITTIILFFVILEASMRVIGLVLGWSQNQANKVSLEDAQSFRILGLGESTTADIFADGKNNSWPHELEKKMKEKYDSESVRVFNGAISGITTSDILANLEGQIMEYKPHLAIVMAGINDSFYMEYKFDLRSDWSLFFYNIKIVKLYKWIRDNIKYHSRKPRYVTGEDSELSPEQWDEFGTFWKTFEYEANFGNIETALIEAESMIGKYQDDLNMITEIMRKIYYYNQSLHTSLEVFRDEFIKKRILFIEDFILEQADKILTRNILKLFWFSSAQ